MRTPSRVVSSSLKEVIKVLGVIKEKIVRFYKDNKELLMSCIIAIGFVFVAVHSLYGATTRFIEKDNARSTVINAVIKLEPELAGASESEIEIDTVSIVYRGKYITLCDASEALVEDYYDNYCPNVFVALIGTAIIGVLIGTKFLADSIMGIVELIESRKRTKKQPASQP